MKQHLIAGLALLLLATSCKKDDDDGCDINTNTIAGTYTLQSLTVSGIDARDVFFDDCEQDNEIVLNANGTYQSVDAGVACDPPGNASGNWNLSGNLLSIDLLPETLTLEDFDCTNLRGSATYMGQEIKVTLRKK
jgi:hypothetical protein